MELPLCDYSFRELFELLGIRTIVRLLTCLLLEHQVLLKSSSKWILISSILTTPYGTVYPLTTTGIFIVIARLVICSTPPASGSTYYILNWQMCYQTCSVSYRFGAPVSCFSMFRISALAILLASRVCPVSSCLSTRVPGCPCPLPHGSTCGFILTGEQHLLWSLQYGESTETFEWHRWEGNVFFLE